MNHDLAAALLGGLLITTTPATATCGIDISSAVSAGQAQSFGTLRGGVEGQVPGQIVDVTLCDEGGRLVYRVLVVPHVANAQSLLVRVDARSGAVLN